MHARSGWLVATALWVIAGVGMCATLADTKIAFDSDAAGVGAPDVYVMDIDGQGVTRLTTQGGSEPDWSPDGDTMTLTIGTGSNLDIAVMSADGSNLVNLTNAATADVSPAWSPDGSRIAFRSLRDGGQGEVYVMDADGANATNISNNGAEDGAPAWSPDGLLIAFVSWRTGNSEVFVVAPDGSGAQNLSNHAALDSEPSWRPDGSQVAFASDRVADTEIWIMDVDGANPLQLTDALGESWHPMWSPDGSQIVFRSTRDGNNEIYVMDADGTNQTRLTANTASDRHPAWSPFLAPLGGEATIAIVAPSAGQTLADGTTSTDLTVDVQNHAAPRHLHWQLDAPFPASGTAGGSDVAAGETTATIAGLTDGTSYTVYVTLVDENHDVLSPPVEASVSFSVDAADPAAADFVRAGSVQGGAGTTITVPVEVYDVSAAGVVGVAVSLTYDSTLLTPTVNAVTVGPNIPLGWTMEYNVPTLGQLHFSMAADFANALMSGGTLVYITFDVATGAVAGTTSPLTLTTVQLNEGVVPATAVSGTFTVLNLVYGDVTGNGAAGAYDAAWVLEHVVNGLLEVDVAFPIETTAPVWASFPLTPAEADAVADVDGDVAVASPDASLILQHEVDIISTFPVEGGGAAPSVRTVAAGGLVRGLGGQARPGGRVVIQLHAGGLADVSSGELRMDYDPSLVRVVDLALRDPSASVILTRADGVGRLALAFASATPVSGDDALLEATFETNPATAQRREGSIRVSRLRLGGVSVRDEFDYAFTIEPYRTRVLANYPNPFNPETWIPFELAAGAAVTIRIYDLAGRRVRALDLGRRSVGSHVTRAEAAYWDGRNDAGESVGSGVYVYELAAGGARSTRRMIVLK